VVAAMSKTVGAGGADETNCAEDAAAAVLLAGGDAAAVADARLRARRIFRAVALADTPIVAKAGDATEAFLESHHNVCARQILEGADPATVMYMKEGFF
jgi:hypothetical protein